MENKSFYSCFGRLALGVILLIFLTNCSQQKENDHFYDSNLLGKHTETSILLVQDAPSLKLEIKKQNLEKGKTSEFLQIEEIIYLDNTSPIGKIDKILFWEDRIYVLDRHITKTLSCYNSNGKFLHAVGTLGEGPGEIMQIYDAQVNPYANSMDVWDGVGQKLMSFDKDGQLLKETNVDLFATEFAPLDASIYLFFKGNTIIDPDLKHKFVAIDINTREVKGKYFPIQEGEESFKFRSDKVLHKNYYNNHFYYSEPFNYNIYSFSSEFLSRDLFIECSNRAIPVSLVSYQKPQEDLIDLIYDPSYFGLLNMPIETGDHIYFTINNGPTIVHNLYNKNTQQLKSYNRIDDDLTGLMVESPITVDKDGIIYYVVDPALLRMKIEGESQYLGLSEKELIDRWEETRPIAYEIYQSITEYDNPFIVKCKFIL